MGAAHILKGTRLAPRRMHLHPSPSLEALFGPLRAVRRRMRLQALVDGAARAGLPAAVVALGGAAAARAGWPRAGMAALGGVAAVLAAGAVWAASRRIPLAHVARRVDERHGLAGRLQAALDFASREAPTRFMRAAIDDALASARRVGATSTMARLASPLRRPDGLRGAAVLGAVAVLLLVVPLPAAERAADGGSSVAATGMSAGAGPGAPPSREPPEAPESIAPILLEPERAAAAELLAEERAAGDNDLARTPEQLLALFDALDQRQLSRREALERLGKLEVEAARDRDTLRAELRAAGEALEAAGSTRPLGRALHRGDSAQARRELEILRASPPRTQRDAEQRLAAAMRKVRDLAGQVGSRSGTGDTPADSSTGNGAQQGRRAPTTSAGAARSGGTGTGTASGSAGGGGSAASPAAGDTRGAGRDGAGDARGAGRDGAGDARGAGRDGAGDARGAGRDGAGDARGAGRDGAADTRGAGRDATGDARTIHRAGAGDAQAAGHDGAGASPGAGRDGCWWRARSGRHRCWRRPLRHR